MQKETTSKNASSKTAVKLPARVVEELLDRAQDLIKWQVDIVARTIGCRTTAEDIVQQAMLNIWTTYVTRDNAIRYSIRAVFVTAVRSEVAAEMNRRKRTDYLLRSFLQHKPPLSHYTPNNDFDEEASITFEQALLGLSEEERAVVELRLGGYSFDGIADVLHIANAVARKRMSRAISNLRRIIGRRTLYMSGSVTQ